MKRIKALKICLFDEKELDRILKITKAKKIKCGVCKKEIKNKKITAVFPKKKGFAFVCEEPACFVIAIYETKKLQEKSIKSKI